MAGIDAAPVSDGGPAKSATARRLTRRESFTAGARQISGQ